MKRARKGADEFLSNLAKDLPSEVRPFTPILVFPGDDVTTKLVERVRRISLGAGLLQKKDTIIATRAGVLCFRPPNRFWIESCRKRYIPAREDMVIGTIISRTAENYIVNIGGRYVIALCFH
jgi:exosome complex component RRP40